jgi:hypothetical protein
MLVCLLMKKQFIFTVVKYPLISVGFISGIFESPTPETVKMLSKPLPMQIICDQVREPGNLGAILRVAVGAGCEKVLLTKGQYNIYGENTILRKINKLCFTGWELLTYLLTMKPN